MILEVEKPVWQVLHVFDRQTDVSCYVFSSVCSLETLLAFAISRKFGTWPL